MNKVVLITGAAKGIGRSSAEEFAKKNYDVIANYRNSQKEAEDLKEKFPNIQLYKADVSKREEVHRMIEFVIEKYGKIDILVNNAGIDQEKMFQDISDVDWNEIINNNLYSVFCVTQEVIKYMLNKKEGNIINISSIYGLNGGSCASAYSASKAGIDGLTKSLAKELGPSNIRINSVAPGCIDTTMNSYLNDEEWEELKNETPLRKIGKPIDIAKCILWLAEDEFTTGQVISPNGGFVI